jgi:secreted trypsin-like serine protease
MRLIQKNPNLTILLVISILSFVLVLGCGTPAIPPSFGARIINGEEAKPNSWPWMIFLRAKISNVVYLCGGSIIGQNSILTAAHCVDKVSNSSQLFVFVSLHDLSKITQTNISVLSIHIHPQYNQAQKRTQIFRPSVFGLFASCQFPFIFV